MASEVRSYNPSKIILLVAGAQISGYADGTFINIEPMSDAVTSVSGADGEIARAVGTDKRHTVTLTLLQTSRSNDVLNGLANADSISGAGVVFPVYMQDILGNDIFAAPQCWISKRAGRGFGKEISPREWILHTGEPAINNVGGSNS